MSSDLVGSVIALCLPARKTIDIVNRPKTMATILEKLGDLIELSFRLSENSPTVSYSKFCWKYAVSEKNDIINGCGCEL